MRMIDCLLAIFLSWSSVWSWYLMISPTFIVQSYRLSYAKSFKIDFFPQITLSWWYFERQKALFFIFCLCSWESFGLWPVCVSGFGSVWPADFRCFPQSFSRWKKWGCSFGSGVTCSESWTPQFPRSAWRICSSWAAVTCYSYWLYTLGCTPWPFQFPRSQIRLWSTASALDATGKSVFSRHVRVVRGESPKSCR